VPARNASRARLVQLLTSAVETTGHDLEDVTVSSAGKRRVVRVVVDKDGGRTLDDVAEVSRAVSDLLDAAVITTGTHAYRRPDGIAVIPAAMLGP